MDHDNIGDLCDADKDGDGDLNELDCEPSDPSISHNAKEVCNGKDDDCDGAVDEGDVCQFISGKTCATIKDLYPSAKSGYYQIDPDDAGPLQPFTAYCEMEIEGGGWTLVANHKDGLIPQVKPEGVKIDEKGILSDERWQALRALMTTGMMFVDEKGKVSRISATKLLNGNCKPLDTTLKPTDGRLWHHENSGCDGTGWDYSMIYLGSFSIYGASLYEHSVVKFDVWGYGIEWSYDLQDELLYYIK